ncbi:MAG: hypothetical protein EOP04_09435, partial [Proteobacteria bacterium]
MTDLIRLKEKELHQFQDIRNSQLEAMLTEKDKKIQEMKQKFELLKDDFQYNLQLIEARDKEIERLDQLVKAQQKKNDELEQRVKGLNNKVDHLQLKEAERTEKLEQDKLMHKRVLDELKAVIESMQWSADEEIKTKTHEIERLKSEIYQLNRLKEEALEGQRKDLTATFEAIIQNREESFQEKESEIASQIHLLEKRVEKIHSENAKLKSETKDAKLLITRLEDEVESKEQKIRQLQYDLDDLHRQKEGIEDTLKREVSTLTVELKTLKDIQYELKLDHQQQLEKREKELVREREFRGVVEQRLADVQHGASGDMSALNAELSAARDRAGKLAQEREMLLSEREELLGRLARKRVEIDGLLGEREAVRGEVAVLQRKLNGTEEKLKNVDDAYLSLEREYLAYQA